MKFDVKPSKIFHLEGWFSGVQAEEPESEIPQIHVKLSTVKCTSGFPALLWEREAGEYSEKAHGLASQPSTLVYTQQTTRRGSIGNKTK